MDDRRQASRFKLFQLVKLRYAEEEFLWTEGIDISERGILCEAEIGCVEPQEKVFLLFSIEGEKTIEAQGVVMRMDEDEGKDRCYLGIEFTDLDPDDREKIRKYVKEHMQNNSSEEK